MGSFLEDGGSGLGVWEKVAIESGVELVSKSSKESQSVIFQLITSCTTNSTVVVFISSLAKSIKGE